jgi:NAD(P)-dependent dehydrogenase (short-subunit alcohol dehydrogenase family)
MSTPSAVRATVITRASTGIGRATALHLARRGWQVFAGVRNERDAESLRSENMPSIRPLMIDVTDGASIEHAVVEVRAVLDGRGLAGLVNNAGVGVAVPKNLLPAPSYEPRSINGSCSPRRSLSSRYDASPGTRRSILRRSACPTK